MKRLMIIILIVIIAISSMGCTVKAQQGFKDLKSEFVGLERDVFVVMPDGSTYVLLDQISILHPVHTETRSFARLMEGA
jgi:hypothetical protein